MCFLRIPISVQDMIDQSDADLLTRAFSLPFRQRNIELANTDLNILEWGDQTKPGLLFIHGGAAHAKWWSFIAPFFLPDYYCVAIDLSGHGDSAGRSEYTSQLWADEVFQLAMSSSCFNTPPVIIGHSMGGLIGIRAAAALGNDLPGLIIIDSAVRSDDSTPGRRRKRHNLLGKKRTYKSRYQILSRFRLVPAQDCRNTNILNYIAAESILSTKDGWTWKYDPSAFRDLQPSQLFNMLKAIDCQTLIIRGKGSRILDKESAEVMRSELKYTSDVVVIENAFHHIMLDQPEILIEEIKTALRQWAY